MGSNVRRRLLGLMLVFFIIGFSISTPFQAFASIPNELRLFAGEHKQLDFTAPVTADITVDNPEVLQVNGHSQQRLHLPLNHPFSLSSVHSGHTTMKVKLFGTIPFKTMEVNVVPDLRVIPGGQSIGVKIKSAGIMVVGHHWVSQGTDTKVSPGNEAGLKLGDLITEMDGKPIRDVSKVSEIVNWAGKNGKAIQISYTRGGQRYKTSIRPVEDKDNHVYRLGLYIRDSAAGVGTLTFYAPDAGVYGALGHVISDMDTQTPIVAGGGQIINSTVTSIAKSQNGEPGEKHAHFFEENKVLGNIEKNTEFGIFGKMYEPPSNMGKNALPVAFVEDVHEGPAQIWTVVSNQKVEKFNIRIMHVSRQDSPATKGMVIKVTDPDLLEKTGGIIQGMSGSPIIQDGKLVGAVTHVFVNDPTSGYGCFIEWMLQDAGIVLRNTAKELKAG